VAKEMLRSRPTVFLVESVEVLFDALLGQFFVVITSGVHIQKRSNNVRVFDHQVELARDLLGLFQPVDVAHEERDGLPSNCTKVVFLQTRVNPLETWRIPGMSPTHSVLVGSSLSSTKKMQWRQGIPEGGSTTRGSRFGRSLIISAYGWIVVSVTWRDALDLRLG